MSTYSISSRFRIESQQWDAACDDHKCEVLHSDRSRFRWVDLPNGQSWHEVTLTEWIIVDKVTNERAPGQLSDAFDTLSDAVRALDIFGVSTLRDIEESEARMASRAASCDNLNPTLVWTKDENGDYHGTGTVLGVTVNYVVSRYGRKGWSLVRDRFYGWSGGYSFVEAKKEAQDDFAWRCRCPEEWLDEIPAEAASCDDCEGHGTVDVVAFHEDGTETVVGSESCTDCGGTGSVPAEASSMVDGTDADGHDACPSCTVRDERADMISPQPKLFRDCGDETTVDGHTMLQLETTASLTGGFYAIDLDTPDQVRDVITSLTLEAQELDADYGHARIAMAFADGAMRATLRRASK